MAKNNSTHFTIIRKILKAIYMHTQFRMILNTYKVATFSYVDIDMRFQSLIKNQFSLKNSSHFIVFIIF